MTQRPTEADAGTDDADHATAGCRRSDRGVPRPPVGAPPQWTFPQPPRGRLGNGLEVVSYDVPGQYVISVRAGRAHAAGARAAGARGDRHDHGPHAR